MSQHEEGADGGEEDLDQLPSQSLPPFVQNGSFTDDLVMVTMYGFSVSELSGTLNDIVVSASLASTSPPVFSSFLVSSPTSGTRVSSREFRFVFSSSFLMNLSARLVSRISTFVSPLLTLVSRLQLFLEEVRFSIGSSLRRFGSHKWSFRPGGDLDLD